MTPKPSTTILVGTIAVAAIAGTALAVWQSSPERSVSSAPVPEMSTPSMTSSPSTAPAQTPAQTLDQTPAQTPAPQTVEVPASNQTPAPSIPNSAPPQTPAARKVQRCTVTMARVNDPNPPLNVRSAPSTQGNVVGTLKNGNFVTVVKEEQGWFQISDPLAGWIAKNRTESGCNQKVERVQFGTGNVGIDIRDRFVGTGTHEYLLRANKGQTMTVIGQAGIFPVIKTPSGKTLYANPDDVNGRWSGQLPETGDYTLETFSQYKGYTYAFRVEVR